MSASRTLRTAITRPAAETQALAGLLAGWGGTLAAYPLIRIEPIQSPALASALAAIDNYDWVVVTSAHAAAALAAAEPRRPWPTRVRVAAVGPATAGALAQHGIPVAVTPAEANGSALVAALVAAGRPHPAPASNQAPGGPNGPNGGSTGTPLAGKRVLFPCSDRARAEVPAGLRAAGAHVDQVPVYQNRPDPASAQALADDLAQGQFDALVFTSPSNVEALATASSQDWPELLARVRVIAIGPTTSAELRARGRAPDAEAVSPDPPGLAAALTGAVADRKLDTKNSGAASVPEVQPSNPAPAFPAVRMRRFRRTAALRALVRETRIRREGLVYPLFVCPGENIRRPVESMPGVAQLSIDQLVIEARAAHAAGVPAVILFGIPAHKDPTGTQGIAPDGIVPRAITALKEALPELIVWADVCLCEYTDHGHCGIVRGETVDNDATLPLLAAAAVSYARAGADVVAPSDMMDGRVGAIRAALDQAALPDTIIVSYAAKYASAFYGPFRQAAESAPRFGDRRSYQMDAGNSDEALREVALDLAEGADMVMVKPALPCLDVIHRVKTTFGVPVAAYQVSGEFALVRAAAERGWVDGPAIARESLLAIFRAGADVVLTYFARELAEAGS
jgi:porphobilinogen synthase